MERAMISEGSKFFYHLIFVVSNKEGFATGCSNHTATVFALRRKTVSLLTHKNKVITTILIRLLGGTPYRVFDL